MAHFLPDALNAAVGWAEVLQGRGEIQDAVNLVLDLVGAKHGILLRVNLRTTEEIALSSGNRSLGSSLPARKAFSLSRYLLGDGIGKARAGTIWYFSEFRSLSEHGALAARLGIMDAWTREAAAVVLEPRSNDIDILELRFADRLSTREMEAIGVLMPVLARAWLNRRENLFPPPESRSGRDAHGAGSDRATAWALGSDNPAKFTRSEYRVCALLSRGLGAKAISAELRVSESTVRSHLRSIYAKTNTQGQRELMSQLLWSSAFRDVVEPKPLPRGGVIGGDGAVTSGSDVSKNAYRTPIA